MTIDPKEVKRFNDQAHDWWNLHGPFKPLHHMNPCRLTIIKRALCDHFKREFLSRRPFEGLHFLDVGCGGGLLTEPLARLGATVTGIDASQDAILIARQHGDHMGLSIRYEHTTIEEFSKKGETFDGVLSFELLEHLKELPPFFAALKTLVKSEGLLILSTLNRTPQSFLGAIVGGEYVLRWIPKGTHTWRKFICPAELVRYLEEGGFSPQRFFGMKLNLLTNEWKETENLSINYGVVAKNLNEGDI